MKRRMKRCLNQLAWAASVGMGLLCVLGVAIEVWVLATPYDPARIETFEPSLRMHDRHGTLLREVLGESGQRAIWSELDQINPELIAATIAVEDHRFYEHDGVDTYSVARAVIDNLQNLRIVSGASTLTMQLARLLEPHARTMVGKFGEAILARRLESQFRKDEILEQYLNRAPYGAQSIGVESAAQRYFGKTSKLLSLAEAALIAGLPKAPSRLNPFKNPQAAKRRQLHVLRRLLETGGANADDIERAVREPLHYEKPASAWHARHFTDYILAQHPTPGRIDTTLDLKLQSQAAEAVREHVAALANTGATNAAAIVLDNRSCEILAMVGSANYQEQEEGMVNGALALRQPGSTLKPFTYALAFEQGATPATIVPDIATHYGTATSRLFSPQNFSYEFSGPVMMGSALGRSLNIPAMRVAAMVGPGALLKRLRLVGFTSLRHSAAHYGLGLTLGNGEVSLLALAQGYAMFARGGMSCEATAIIGRESSEPLRVFTPEAAYLTTDVLSQKSFRIAAFGPANSLLLGFPVAVKTGTSSNWRDGWAVGYTGDYTVAVWTGDFGGKSMNRLSGSGGAGPLFNRIMTAVVATTGDTPQSPTPPKSIVELGVCARSGQRAHEDCPYRVTVSATETSMPSMACEWHRKIAIDKRNGLLAGDQCPAEHVEYRIAERLPAQYDAWVARNQGTDRPPSRYSSLCPASGVPPGVVTIRYPRGGEQFVLEPGYARDTQSLELRADVAAQATRVQWLVDGKTIARSEWPFVASWQLAPGTHVITAKARGQRAHSVEIEVK